MSTHADKSPYGTPRPIRVFTRSTLSAGMLLLCAWVIPFSPGYAGATIVETPYQEQKVVIDFFLDHPDKLGAGLYWLRAIFQTLNAEPYGIAPDFIDAKVVIHGTEIVALAKKNYAKYKEVVERMRYYTEFARAGDGLAAVALRTDDAKGAYSELLWAGFAPSDPMDFSRPVRLSDGVRDARFRITQIAPDKTPGGRFFVCEHFTREVVWRPEYQAHPNGATALAALAIVAEDVAAAAAPYERMLDNQAQPIAEGLLVATGSAPIALVTASALAHRLPGVAAPARPAPAMAALFIRVKDRDTAERVLAAGGLRPRRMLDGSIALGPERAHGVALVFG